MRLIDCERIETKFAKNPLAKIRLKSVLTMILLDLKTHTASYSKFRYYAIEHAVFVLAYEFLTAAEIEKIFKDSDYLAALADDQKGVYDESKQN